MRKRNKKKTVSKRTKGGRRWIKLLTIALALAVIMILTTGAAVYALLFKFAEDIPDVEVLKDYKPSLVTSIYADNNELIGKYFIENRVLLPIDKIPTLLKNATIAVEDAKFYSHSGIDMEGIMRAFWQNFIKGKVVQGGSTITQQLAKTLFLSPEKSIERKLKEVVIAINIERKFPKSKILEFYLNQIYYGHGAYGVEAAAMVYFGKHVEELNIAESAMIAGLPKAPSIYSPFNSPKRAKSRREHVLNRMVDMKIITKKEAIEAKNSEFVLAKREVEKSKAPYFTEYIRFYLEKKYGVESLYRGGLKVYTPLNLRAQSIAEKAVRKGLKEADKRYGYRGALSNISFSSSREIDWKAVYKLSENINGIENSKDIAIGQLRTGVITMSTKDKATVELNTYDKGTIDIKNMSWARKPDIRIDGKFYRGVNSVNMILKKGDVVLVSVLDIKVWKKGIKDIALALEQEPEVQGALLAIEPETGFIKSMVGGYDFNISPFNRSVQALRQPGSAFKPLVYSAAINKGFTPATAIIDSPIIYNTDGDASWKPENFEEKFYGSTTLRNALAHSRNIVTIKLLKSIGISYLIDYARKFGITSPLSEDLSIGLGTSSMSLMELTSAYGVFGNGGVRAEPLFINTIKDRDGNILEQGEIKTAEVIDKGVAYLTTDIMKDVIQYGTGKIVKSLNRPVAGKTGTTNKYIDAWFIGFVPHLVTGVWVGIDKKAPLGEKETGSRAAAPIWLDYMTQTLEDTPIEDFLTPPEVVFAKIDKNTGKLAGFNNKNSYFEVFISGKEPAKYEEAKDTEVEKNFFMMDSE